jgi:hypothetical protein
MTPSEIWKWLLLGGGLGIIIVGVIKSIEWFLQRFVTRKEYDELKGRVATLEHSSITDAARQVKQLEIMADYIKIRNRER